MTEKALITKQIGKISVFCIPEPGVTSNVRALAIDQQGEVIVSGICSSPGWAAEDYANNPGDFVLWFYGNRYPGGYQATWFDEPPPHWGLDDEMDVRDLQRYHRGNDTDYWRHLVVEGKNLIAINPND